MMMMMTMRKENISLCNLCHENGGKRQMKVLAKLQPLISSSSSSSSSLSSSSSMMKMTMIIIIIIISLDYSECHCKLTAVKSSVNTRAASITFHPPSHSILHHNIHHPWHHPSITIQFDYITFHPPSQHTSPITSSFHKNPVWFHYIPSAITTYITHFFFLPSQSSLIPILSILHDPWCILYT